MNRRVFALAAVGSVALHAWLIWPSRPAAPEDDRPDAAPTRVAVREVEAERIDRMRRMPSAAPAEAEVPPPPAEKQAPTSAAAQVAEAPPVAEPSPPVAVAAAPPPSAVASTEGAAPTAAPSPTPAPVHVQPSTPEAIVESGGGNGSPASGAARAQIESFEAQAARLAEQAPTAQPPTAVPSPAVASVASPAPAPREIPRVQIVPRAPRPAPKSPAFPWLKRESARGEVALASAAAAPASQAVAAPPPAPSSVPMRVLPREPVPYRPVNIGGGRGGAGRSMSEAFGQAVDRGSMASLASPPPQDPVARIAWGSAPDAMRLLDIGRMALVTVDDQLRVVGAVEMSGGTWRRAASVPDLSSFSNRVRVVDHVAGFSAPASLCGPQEHLAVVVPIGLERRIDRAMDEAARRQGLARTQVAACYGRLVAQPNGIEFEIDRVERRNGT